jgi:hypothetical protein
VMARVITSFVWLQELEETDRSRAVLPKIVRLQ